ncbi:MAG: galactose-1-phosphate uridylyltransferase [Bdellovibrionia bacterium]
MHKLHLQKTDGRNLHLYSRSAIEGVSSAPSPQSEPVVAKPHLRWHPLRAEWVAYASHRQGRTFLPPPEYNPLKPSRSEEFPTELPVGNYDVAVFENLFPTLTMNCGEAPALSVPTRPALGACEVVVFTQDPSSSLGQLPLDHLELLIRVWGERYQVLSQNPAIHYVMPFENRGVEVGVTLHHPHGQIYSYPVVPPLPAQQIAQLKAHAEKTGRGLLEDLIQMERKEQERMVFAGESVSAFVPICARYPYEVWIAPHRAAPSLAELTDLEIRDLARALKTVLLKYDGLWRRPFPYLMVIHQAPTQGEDRQYSHVHFEFYPPYRTESRLKFLAGTELGAGLFASDSLPEAKAAELRAVEVKLE